jgi:hypothetical protein
MTLKAHRQPANDQIAEYLHQTLGVPHRCTHTQMFQFWPRFINQLTIQQPDSGKPGEHQPQASGLRCCA